jgi:hypothetical protein
VRLSGEELRGTQLEACLKITAKISDNNNSGSFRDREELLDNTNNFKRVKIAARNFELSFFN